MLSEDVERYVALHRAAGRVFRDVAIHLAAYAAFAQARGEEHVRTRTALEWARRVKSAQQRRRRLLIVRRFAEAMAAENDGHEVPPADLLPRAPYVRPKPYIYSPAEISSLLAAAEACSTAGCPVAGQYRVLFGLLACTGLRISEALGIDLGDMAGEELLIRSAKRKGRRLLPLHSTTRAVLGRHVAARRRVQACTDALFLADSRRRLSHKVAWDVFQRMLARTGLMGKGSGGSNPRIHDLRHTFSVRSLEALRAPDRTVATRHMVALSTWLGHSRVEDTYWYLDATPELMRRIAGQTESHYKECAP